MKVKYSTTWLSGAALEGTSGASWNGKQINDETAFFRAAASTFFGRGGRSTTFTFRVTKTFASEAALLLWAATHFSTLPLQADLTVTDDAGTVAVTLADAVIDEPQISNQVGISLTVQYTFRGGLFESDDVPEDSSGVPNNDTVKSGYVTLTPGAESGSVAFLVGFGSTPKVILQVCPPTGGTMFGANPVYDTITSAGFDYVLNFPVPASGTYRLSWIASL